MDIWVVAAAAGAGYVAKFWQNVVKDRDVLSGSFAGNTTEERSNVISKSEKELSQKRSELGTLNNKDGSIFRRRVRRQISESNSPNNEENSANSAEMISDISRLSIDPAQAIASTSGITEDEMKENDRNFSEKLDSASKIPVNAWQPDFSPINFNMGSGFGKSRSFNSKWSRRYYSVKPMTSLESCLIAQIYRQQVEAEEYIFSSVPSTSNGAISPFLVTDGKQIVSRSGFSCSSFVSTKQKLEMSDGSGLRETDIKDSTSNIHRSGLLELPGKVIRQRRKVKHKNSSISNVSPTGKYFKAQDSMILLCVGILLGVISTIVGYKKEVDNLNELLKQNQNLVQDLQEELDMKDSLTVKELRNESWESQEMVNPSAGTKADEDEDFKSKIEAELEAELERLELNMSAACLERTFSDLSEVDPDLVGDLVQGELKAELVNHVNDSDHDIGSSSTNCAPSGKYGVSPNELSLRLHEVIESRLEERIAELEIELQGTKRRLHLMETEKMNSNRDMSYSEFESSSTQGSPTVLECGNPIVEPVVMNLSGEALNAYNEVYDEFMRIAELDGTPPTTEGKSKQTDDSSIYSFDRRLHYNGVGGHGTGMREFGQLGFNKGSFWEQREGPNETDSDEEDDELGKLLIKQIVEKTRQGSPVVLNAQKMLRTLDEQLRHE